MFDVHVTVHRRHSESKEPTTCDKLCSLHTLSHLVSSLPSQLTVFESELTTFLDPQTIYKYSIHWMFNTYFRK
jgi:hypothetical protein